MFGNFKIHLWQAFGNVIRNVHLWLKDQVSIAYPGLIDIIVN